MLEESPCMPFVILYPAEIQPGTRVADIIINIDFAELFLDYAGCEVPDSMQGRSFRDNLRGQTPTDWPCEMYYHYWTADQPCRPSHYGIRTKEHKLIYYYGLVREGCRPEDCWEFYDLRRDPQELINRYAEKGYEDVIAKLKVDLVYLRSRYDDTVDPLTAG